LDKLSIGIVGVGKLGEFHLKLLKELALERNDVALSGIFEANALRAKSLSKQYQTRQFASLDELAGRSNAAIIAAPTSAHFEIALTLLEKGLHLFIEKPITAAIEQANKLIEAERVHKVKIQVGHIERFNPALVAAEPFLGEPVFIAAERLSGFSKRVTDVSVVLDLMIHDIDLILSLVKSEVKTLAASGVSVFSNELDIANARIEFVNGAAATVTASRISRSKVRKMRFFCKNPSSYASLDLGSGKAEIFRIVDAPSERKTSLKEFAMQKIVDLFGDVQDALDGKMIEYHAPEPPKLNALKEELKSFIESILRQTPIRVDSRAGARALTVAEKIVAEINASRR
jgi:predicted dehydrogenase